MSARFFSSIGGFRIQTDTTEIKLTEDEGKELIASVLKFMEGTTPGEIAPLSRAWLTGNPILLAFEEDPERHALGTVGDYLLALDEYQNRPDAGFDEAGELRLSTYHRVANAEATPAQVQEAYDYIARLA